MLKLGYNALDRQTAELRPFPESCKKEAIQRASDRPLCGFLRVKTGGVISYEKENSQRPSFCYDDSQLSAAAGYGSKLRQ